MFYLLVKEPPVDSTSELGMDANGRPNSLMTMSQMFIATAAPFCPNIGAREITMLTEGNSLLCPLALTGLGGASGLGTGAAGLSGKKPHNKLRWNDWLTKPTFWKVAFIYMFIRLFLTLTQVYMPLYLKFSLQMPNVSPCHLM